MEEPVYAPRRTRRINKKNKLHIVFDETARREFLTGFHKRKLQRQKKAAEELKEQLKAERKRIKLESKERYKKLVQSYKPIPELEEQFAKEYEVKNATVSVLELDTDLLAETNFLIGRNRGTVKEEPDDEDIKEENEAENDEEELPGMELRKKKCKEVISTDEKLIEPKTKKELKRELKKEATSKVKKSKVYQRKNKLERVKQKKKSMRLKKENMKIQAKSKKGKVKNKAKIYNKR